MDAPPTIPLLASISTLRERYDAWLCDVWGVVHNGVRAFPEAVAALSRFRESGGRVLLLTNAPRPAAPIFGQLAHLGVPRGAFDGIVTSGDATRRWLGDLGEAPVLHIGPDRDRTLFADLDINLVDADEATVVLCTGLIDDKVETVSDYDPMLSSLASRGVVMMCANPDIVVDRGGTLVPCAGALAERYERLGGRAIYAGKPHGAIYDLAFQQLRAMAGAVPLQRILAIGDGIGTDIAGADAAGLDSVFVIGGIHIGEVVGDDGETDPRRLAGLFAGMSRLPVAAQRVLAW